MNDYATVTRAGLDAVRSATSGTRPDGAPCMHPPARLWAWYARDDRMPGGEVLCVACCDCGAVLAGGATLDDESEGNE